MRRKTIPNVTIEQTHGMVIENVEFESFMVIFKNDNIVLHIFFSMKWCEDS